VYQGQSSPVDINPIKAKVRDHLDGSLDKRRPIARVGHLLKVLSSATADRERHLQVTVLLLEEEQLLEVAIDVIALEECEWRVFNT